MKEAVAIQSLLERTRRWWQDGQKWRVFAGEGEEALVTAVGALEAGEAGGEVAAAEEGFDGGGGGGVERAEILAMFGFVIGQKSVPAVVDELPEGIVANSDRLSLALARAPGRVYCLAPGGLSRPTPSFS